MPAKLTHDEFIIRANAIHNSKYNYDKALYINVRTHVIITCPVHGDFEQTPDSHFRNGCLKCGRDSTAKKLSKGKDVFISQARKVFGDIYNYDKVPGDVSNTSIVTITCAVHGDFKKRVSDHLTKKRGCNMCNKYHEDGTLKQHGLTTNTENFIKKANKKHNFEYTYDKAVYVDSKTKIIITCKEHGDFKQSPGNHLTGYKCSKCSGVFRYNQETFIEKCKEVHGNKYCYDKTKFKLTRKRVIITCPVHGDFEQIAASHINGSGCGVCGGTLALTNETFIAKSREVHGNKYDYSLVEYTRLKDKVEIICSEHGVFEQQPSHHLHGKTGCPQCSGSVKSTTDEFVKKASKVHNGKYTYTKVNYQNAHTDVIIDCHDHGSFVLTPNTHLNGSGCPECSRSNQQFAYIHVISDAELPIALKFGIEKVKGRRKRRQNNSCMFTVSSMMYYFFSTSNACKEAEKECKKVLENGVLSKREMPDGHTETTSLQNLEAIIAIYEKWGGVKQ